MELGLGLGWGLDDVGRHGEQLERTGEGVEDRLDLIKG